MSSATFSVFSAHIRCRRFFEHAALYLTSVFVHDMSSGNPDVTDRSSRGLQRPWDSAGRHVYILNKPEQLRGPRSPHRKARTQNWEAGIFGPSVVACVPLSTQGRLCVLDSQDSCCPLFFSAVAFFLDRLNPSSPIVQAHESSPIPLQSGKKYFLHSRTQPHRAALLGKRRISRSG